MTARTSTGWVDYAGVEHPKPPRPKKAPAVLDGDLFAPVVPAARWTDPDTSNEGIRDVLPRAGGHQHKLLLAFAAHPMGLTSEEAAELAGLNTVGTCYWKRISELLRDGRLEDTFQTRTASTGSEQRILALTAKGRQTIP